MNVSDIGCNLVPPWSKEALNRMILKLGREETNKRFAWLCNESEEIVDGLIETFLTDDFADDHGVRGGHFFWGNA